MQTHNLQPDALFASYKEVTPAYLNAQGIKLLFTDVDNTLAPYEVPEPDDAIRSWLLTLAEAGIKVIFVSNNKSPRLERFNKTLVLPAYPDCKKPFGKIFLRVADKEKTPISACAMLGDQIFTDVWAAKRNKMFSIMVPPIKDKTTLFFKTKRRLERPILKRFAKAHPDHIDLSFWKIKE